MGGGTDSQPGGAGAGRGSDGQPALAVASANGANPLLAEVTATAGGPGGPGGRGGRGGGGTRGAGGRGGPGGGEGEGWERDLVRRDLSLLLRLLPPRWKECVTAQLPPTADWVWVGAHRVRYVGEGQHALFCVLRSGRLECLEESEDSEEEDGDQATSSTISPSAEPALVYFQSQEGPSPHGIAPWQRAKGGLWFLGTWGSLELDPTVWGIDTDTPLFRITVKAARQRMAQRRVWEECLLYRRGRAIIPPIWESFPGLSPSSRDGLAALEAQWGAPRPSPSAPRRRVAEFQASLDASYPRSFYSPSLHGEGRAAGDGRNGSGGEGGGGREEGAFFFFFSYRRITTASGA